MEKNNEGIKRRYENKDAIVKLALVHEKHIRNLVRFHVRV